MVLSHAALAGFATEAAAAAGADVAEDSSAHAYLLRHVDRMRLVLPDCPEPFASCELIFVVSFGTDFVVCYSLSSADLTNNHIVPGTRDQLRNHPNQKLRDLINVCLSVSGLERHSTPLNNTTAAGNGQRGVSCQTL